MIKTQNPPGHRRLILAIAVFFVSRFFGYSQDPASLKLPIPGADPFLTYKKYTPKPNDRMISRDTYLDQLYGFWLGACIANWTGLITEMDKIGNIGDIKTGPFYTRKDWGKPDHPNIWSQGNRSPISPTIDFVFAAPDSIWGADDDTDIEYMYQYLLYVNKTSVLTGPQIRDGWLAHIKPEEENYLWVSNQKAFDLMKAGIVPPETSHPDNNPEFEMIDAQLTTEIFGLFAPARPDMALTMANLPIQTTARRDAEWISEFYVIMHSLASRIDSSKPRKKNILWMADTARKRLPAGSYAAGMYDFVKSRYLANVPWEQTRDDVYQRYQVEQADGYHMTSQERYCNGCFAAGINFASSLISLFYGEGDLKKTIKIGALAGWDSDNPTSTWGGLLGFMLGKKGIEKTFKRTFSDRFHIHRTRTGFPNDGKDTFAEMAKMGVWITDRVVQEALGGGVDLEKNCWYIPDKPLIIAPGSSQNDHKDE
ncbi:MAG: ADP-ribosylglycohydrolase family protein [Haliscomenobacter sp.]|nr:ADP-ribosylglycohydrolase family protein [Haliscomenobacter sp.]